MKSSFVPFNEYRKQDVGSDRAGHEPKPNFRRALFLLLAALILPVPALASSDTIDAWCDELGTRLRSVSADTCRHQDFVAAPESTARGNALVMRDIAAKDNSPTTSPKRVLVIGGIHGDELTSVSTVFRWMGWLGQPDAALYQWRVIPVANPDGLLAKPSTRVNANGVDLNRNFQTPDWDKDAQNYWTQRTHSDPRRYPGKSGGSEIETRWLQKQIEEFHPDLIISVHAPYNLLDYDGPVPEPMRFGRLLLNRLGVYPGSMGNYSGLFKQIPVITIELPHATAMPPARDQQALWEDMLKWMKNNLKATANYAVAGGQ
ncbi:MAG TPA: M14 family zinc carboxypeptidase [Gallionella sp.]|nr:M14 family zinc carboxypeptidase [Gallionella sp.]